MGISVGSIGLDLKLNGKGLRQQINHETKMATSSMEGMFASSFKKIGALAATAFSIHAIGKFAASSISLGSDLTEVQNVVDTAFPHMTSQVNEFAKSAMTSFGLSELMAKQFMGTFGAMSKAFGFSEKQAYEMSTALTGLSGDVASFYNLDPTEAYTKLKSVFTGETETLKDLGVVMTQNALDQYAMANDYGTTTSKMTEQEKVALRLDFVTKQLNLASGDFIKTQDSWANQTRILTLRFQSFKAAIGKGLIALFAPIVRGINWVLANLQPLADSFASLMEMLTGYSGDTGGSALSDASSELGTVSNSADDLGTGLSDAGKKGEKAAKKIKNAFAGVDTINKLTFGSDNGSDDDSGSGESGTGAGDGSIADAVEFPKATKQASIFNGVLDGIINEFKRLSEIFKTGFRIGFADSFKDLEKIKIYLGSIKDDLLDIFTDNRIQDYAGMMIDSIVMSIGKQLGAVVSIGTTFATLFIGSISTYLHQNTGFLKDRLVRLFDITAVNAYLVGEFAIAIADIARVFAGSRAIQIGANLIQAIVNGTMNTLVLLSEVSMSILSSITEPIIKNKNMIKKAITEALTPLIDVSKSIANAMTDWDSFTGIFGAVIGALGALKAVTLLVTPAVINFGLAVKKWGIASALKGLASSIIPKFVAALSAIVSPIGIAVTAIGAFGAAIGYLYATSATFRDQINGIFASIANNVGGVITGLVQIIQTIWTQGIQPIVTNTITAFQYLWDNGLAILIENVSIFAMQFINFIMSIWNNAINPLVDLFLSVFLPTVSMVWEGVLAVAVPIIEKIMEYVNMFMDVLNVLMDVLNQSVLPIFKTVFHGLSDTVKAFYEFAKPFIDDFMQILGNVVTFAMDYFLSPLKIVFGTVVEVIKDITAPIKETLTGVKEMLQGVIDFVLGVFTGDWKKAWSGVKSIFSGMWNSLKGIVKTAWNGILSLFSNAGKIFSGVVDGIAKVFKNIVNCIIDGMNRVIRIPFDKINGLLNSIRDFSILGQKPFAGLWGYDPLPVPQIPKLAQGGYVKANQPQLAMIGDNKRYGEIVAPENKMMDMIDTALVKQKEQDGSSRVVKLLEQILALIAGLNLSVEIDRKKLAILIRQAEKELEMIGG